MILYIIIAILSSMKQKANGFTIVEMLIVIVVVGVLAAITVFAYNTALDKARASKIKTDIAHIVKAIIIARNSEEKTLYDITGGRSQGVGGTTVPCSFKPAGTDFAKLPKTDNCWKAYSTALSRISQASGVNINGMTDPWGRPYKIMEVEKKLRVVDQI